MKVYETIFFNSKAEEPISVEKTSPIINRIKKKTQENTLQTLQRNKNQKQL